MRTQNRGAPYTQYLSAEWMIIRLREKERESHNVKNKTDN